ncbi:MAG: phosphoenolpyruvate--protein phosphotransferase [Phycisphaerae bacterium]|nr:phosphoenolpyruvate--protein phosphotransferase [Phycisphaerae bacterium]MCZ2400713.1 phosphoenolpyruvate--protein phosphotransferase [Phycisphaerae bacterium]NUQ48638.1 phosphoenolpyruvate--protein phosphotransferase [Phycisphaerae bacterium]
MITKKGISASPGVAIGPALVLDTEEYRIPRRTITAAEAPAQVRVLDAALEASRQEISDLREAAARKLGEQTADIFRFHEALIADKTLRAAVTALIEQQHYSAAYAFVQEMSKRQRVFRAVPDPYLKERVRDLVDIEKRVLRHILGRAREDITKLSEPVVIVAHDIMPSTALQLDREHILAFATNVGGQTSHTAIIARGLGIPAVVALNDLTADVSGGETVIIDGMHGIVVANPDAETVARYEAQRDQHKRQTLELRGIRDLPSVTRDKTAIRLLSNIELADETRNALDSGAEGVGLYRTEFLFLASERVPTEDQQYEAFRAAVRHARGKSVVIRTVDLGADKLMASMGPQHDQNPDLGLRSLRFCLQHLDMFKTHLRAILRAAAEGDVRVMFPMITTLLELRQAKATLNDVMEDLEEDGVPFRRDIPIGIMVETPAAALLASSFAKEVAFMSIGTNDLTQYTLAVDRANERVAYLYSPHNPAVLKLIREVVQAANKAQVAVNLCGEMAGEPLYCELLVGLGLRQLSMAPKDIPEVKRIVRSTTIKRCEAVARKVMRFDGERQVHNFLHKSLEELRREHRA